MRTRTKWLSGIAAASTAGVTAGLLLTAGSPPSAQCLAAVRANNAYVASIVQEGPLTLGEQYAALAGAKAHAERVNRLCGPSQRIAVLTVPR